MVDVNTDEVGLATLASYSSLRLATPMERRSRNNYREKDEVFAFSLVARLEKGNENKAWLMSNEIIKKTKPIAECNVTVSSNRLGLIMDAPSLVPKVVR